MSAIDVLIEDDRWSTIDLEALAERAATAALFHLGLAGGGYEAALLACNDARIAALNADFRGKPVPTNVLSWPSSERGADTAGAVPPPPGPGDEELGDIAIAWETCATEAEAAGRPMAAHVTHLVVHGFLHLLGYDHERDEDAALMERLEAEILDKVGVANPYEMEM
ncbi:rRNA maturation RNase YbeY [Pseudoroseicyclus tamaricis]|uniref:Endoribonuclease YbeY n=1 Tax=Pseudoroseicyclus tamaricis TaxID=2705421 RepID=A0A6B2JK33_9RHOB|nr:rRNA maturation RNase YbeY [Pseudoroseicyclus tamaricis]NDV01803.1 rRNA maturation RNase YbeY [Pseudoroseicyclus tamaricis]